MELCLQPHKVGWGWALAAWAPVTGSSARRHTSLGTLLPRGQLWAWHACSVEGLGPSLGGPWRDRLCTLATFRSMSGPWGREERRPSGAPAGVP